MFHANFHGDFFNLSKITFFCFDLSKCLPPRSFFGVVLPVTPRWAWASFAPTLGQSVVRLLKRLWRLYQPVPPQCPIPFFFFFSPSLFLSLSLLSPQHQSLRIPVTWWLHRGPPCRSVFTFLLIRSAWFSLLLAWHIKGDLWVIEPWTQNIKLSALPGSIKTTSPPPPAITYHLHPSSGRKLLVSLTDVYWRHLISKG